MKKLVFGKSYDSRNKSSFAFCPHCLKQIDELSATECIFCKNKVSWIQQQLTTEEQKIDSECRKEGIEKLVQKTGIKPCPFCGEPIGYPDLDESGKNGVSLKIGCWNCGVYLYGHSIKFDIESINVRSKELIEKWNKRT